MAQPKPIGAILPMTNDNRSSPDTSSRSSQLQIHPNLTSPAIIKLKEKFKDGAELLTAFNPAHQCAYCRDVARVHTGKAPSIGLVQSAYGRSVAESWLEIQLNNLSEFAGCKEKLRPDQIMELAQMMIMGYPHYKLTEFMLFFQRFKQCKYGKFYGAVDPMVILQALSTFEDERIGFLEKVRQEEERVKQSENDRQYELLRQRYRDRVPHAFEDDAPIDFLQYRLMGYDGMPDDELAKECEDISSGRKKIPKQVTEVLAMLRNIAKM